MEAGMRVAMKQRAARFAPAAEPNIVPFIDVLLVLLIIFMVTAPRPTVDLRVDLPSRNGALVPIIAPTVVNIAQDAGRVRWYVNDVEAPGGELAARTLAHVLAGNPALTAADVYSEARIHVRADQDIAYARVIEALDALQRAHFAKVSLSAQRADEV
jgi:biopolymer transport protein ExbD